MRSKDFKCKLVKNKYPERGILWVFGWKKEGGNGDFGVYKQRF